MNTSTIVKIAVIGVVGYLVYKIFIKKPVVAATVTPMLPTAEELQQQKLANAKASEIDMIDTNNALSVAAKLLMKQEVDTRYSYMGLKS